MGFWNWLKGKKSTITTSDRVWLSSDAKCRGIRAQLLGQLSSARTVILLAHFPATLADIRQDLDQHGVAHNLIAGQISTKEVNRLADDSTQRLVHVGLVKDLRLDSFPDQVGEDEGLIQFVVAERHFLRERDDVVIAFGETLRKRCHVVFHISLKDPLTKIFRSDRIIEILQRLGMEKSDAVESALVARRIRGAQKRFATRGKQARDADSAEEWLKENGFEEFSRDANASP